MNNHYAEAQKRLIEELKATQSFKDDGDPFRTLEFRKNEFEGFLGGPDGLPSCGCGDPEETLRAFLDALDFCALSDVEIRKTFLQEKFGAEYVSSDRLVQLVFYILSEKTFIEHGGGVGGSWLTSAGKVFRAVLRMYLQELDMDQELNWEFDIDFDAILAAE